MRIRTWAAAAAVVTGVALSACSGNSSSESSGDRVPLAASSGAAAPGPGAAKSDVKITRSGFEDSELWGPHAYVVHYTITNHGKDAADYFAQFEFLDKDGDVLGSTGVTADKLGAGKSKTADTAPVESEIENGKPTDIRSVRVSAVDRT